MQRFREHPEKGMIELDVDIDTLQRLALIHEGSRRYGKRLDPCETMLKALDDWLDDAERKLARLQREHSRLEAATSTSFPMGPAPQEPPQQRDISTGCCPTEEARKSAVEVRKERYPRRV